MNSPKKHDDDDESVVSDTSVHSHAKKEQLLKELEEIENKLKQKMKTEMFFEGMKEKL